MTARPDALLARLDAAGWGYVYEANAGVRASKVNENEDAEITVAIYAEEVGRIRVTHADGAPDEIRVLLDEIERLVRGPCQAVHRADATCACGWSIYDDLLAVRR